MERTEAEWIARVEALEKIVLQQAERIKQLEEALEKLQKPPKDSSNSGKPPSQDQNRKYTPRDKTGRPTGGQKGHTGNTRMQVEAPDIIIPVLPEACVHCGSVDLHILPEALERRQVVDIPPIEPLVTEYRQLSALCTRCGKASKKPFPGAVSAPVQMGPQVMALAGYLKVAHYMSHERLTLLFSDLFGLEMSEGTIQNRLQGLSEELKDTYQHIKSAIQSAWLLASDETICKIAGKKRFTWVFQTDKHCLFTSNQSRGYTVIESVLEGHTPEVSVSDRYNAQLKVPSKHQLCLVHLLRILKYIIQAEQSQWAEALHLLLKEAIHLRKQTAQEYDTLSPGRFRQVQQLEEKLANLFQKPPPGKAEGTLFRELLGRQASLLLFLHDPHIPFENNASERALRNRVTHRNVTGGFRSPEGAFIYDVLSSLLETAKRQGLNILNLFSGSQLLAFPTTC